MTSSHFQCVTTSCCETVSVFRCASLTRTHSRLVKQRMLAVAIFSVNDNINLWIISSYHGTVVESMHLPY